MAYKPTDPDSQMYCSVTVEHYSPEGIFIHQKTCNNNAPCKDHELNPKFRGDWGYHSAGLIRGMQKILEDAKAKDPNFEQAMDYFKSLGDGQVWHACPHCDYGHEPKSRKGS